MFIRFSILFTSLYLAALNSFASDVVVTQREATGKEKQEIIEMLKTSPVSADEINAVKEYSARLIKLMQERGASDFSYDEKSVEILSRVIDEEHATYSTNAKMVLPSIYGAYLGEAILQKYKGKWVKFGDGSLGLSMENGHYIMPMRRAYKHIHNGTEDSIIALYVSMKDRK